MKTVSSKSLMRVLALVVLVAIPSVGRADVLRGDVNGDGKVNIQDVTALINYLLKQDASLIVQENADVDASGLVNIGDVTTLISQLLKGGSGTNPDPAEGDWVDLGLPSGTLWATRNVGANNPEDYGDYFAWGETEPKDYYDWNTYKWSNGSYSTLTKYCNDSTYGYNGFTDGKTELDPEDDAAYVNWGPSWRMPTIEQQQELCDSCTWTSVQRNGVNGYLATGPNGNTIFLPATGDRWNENQGGVGTSAFYWSRTLYSKFPGYAYYFTFYTVNVYWHYCHRYFGQAVRAVRVP